MTRKIEVRKLKEIIVWNNSSLSIISTLYRILSFRGEIGAKKEERNICRGSKNRRMICLFRLSNLI